MSKHDNFEASLAVGKFKEDILRTEYSEKFDNIRKNIMIVSYYK